MTRRFSKMFGRSRWLNVGLVALLVLVLAGGWYFIFASKSTASPSRTATVASGTVTSTVTASGTVESSGNYELSFPTNGIVTKVEVAVGQKVQAGEPLVSIDSTTAAQQLASAKSNYAQALTTLSQSNLTLADAQQAVTDANTNAAANAISYQQAIDAAQIALDSANAGASPACFDSASQPSSTGCSNSQAWSTLRTAEAAVTSAQLAQQQAQSQAAINMNGYNAAISQATTADAQVNANNARDKGVLADQAAINNAATNLFKANVALLQAKDTLTKAAVTAQQSFNTAVLNQQKGIAQDQQTIRKARQALASTQASTNAPKDLGVESVAAASAAASKDQLTIAEHNYEQTTLRAPVSGVVGALSATVGQSSAASSSGTGSSAASSATVTLVAKGKLDVAATFNEADAAKVSAGMPATITFTALPNASATGKVISVSPVATVSSGLVTYPVKISIKSPPKGVRAGMTANVAVVTSQATNVLVVPSTAITTLGGLSTVTIKNGDQETVVQVALGIKGDSTTEVTSGLKAGDVIIIPTAAASTSGFPTGGVPGGLSGGRTSGGSFGGGGARG